jgi:threonyl-tRNA synthetase
MHGLLRVRGFTQDDTHIFCRMDQLQTEIRDILKLARKILNDFGFTEYEVMLSTRPEKFAGEVKNWDLAEATLSAAMTEAGFAFQVDAGEGTFYGPKIDLKIKDSIGRRWQCSTVQVDFNNPERFDCTYRSNEGKNERVVMIHRALLGSLERFFGILVEHYAGAFPIWLAPIQAAVLPITDTHVAYAEGIVAALKAAGIRVELRGDNEKIGAKIRNATMDKIPYMLVVGDKEVEAKAVAVRTRGGKDLGSLPVDAFLERIRGEIASKSPQD